MNSFDVIVVGAGPAGSTCAGKLHEAGLNVKLLDKKVFPRVKPCAGWITPEVSKALQLDLYDYRLQNTLQPITSFRTGIMGGRMIDTSYPRPISFGILRREFDDYLLRRSGVACEFEAVRDIQREGEVWRINGQFQAPLLIGAGGHFCPVARWACQQDAASNDKPVDAPIVVYAQEVEFEMSPRQQEAELLAERPELYFCNDLAGYGWCFRKGRYLNIGLGRTQKEGLSDHVSQFCNFLRSENKLVDALPDRFLGHAYQLYAERPPQLFGDGLLLVGDAAGLAYPQSGEGIRPAVESALLAAEVISAAGGNYGEAELSSYADRITERFGKPASFRPVRWLPAAWLQHLAARLMATRWFSRRVVVESWFLNRDQPAL